MHSSWRIALCAIAALTIAPAEAQVPVVNESAVLTPGDGQTTNQFGSGIAVDGSLAVVGAFFDSDRALQAGAAYIYQQSNPGVWTQVAKIQRATLRHAVASVPKSIRVTESSSSGDRTPRAFRLERRRAFRGAWVARVAYTPLKATPRVG